MHLKDAISKTTAEPRKQAVRNYLSKQAADAAGLRKEAIRGCIQKLAGPTTIEKLWNKGETDPNVMGKGVRSVDFGADPKAAALFKGRQQGRKQVAGTQPATKKAEAPARKWSDAVEAEEAKAKAKAAAAAMPVKDTARPAPSRGVRAKAGLPAAALPAMVPSVLDKLKSKRPEAFKSLQPAGMPKEGSDRKQSVRDHIQKLAEEPEACDTPGEKKRSDGEGRGLAIGGGKGPINRRQRILALLRRDEQSIEKEAGPTSRSINTPTQLMGTKQRAAKKMPIKMHGQTSAATNVFGLDSIRRNLAGRAAKKKNAAGRVATTPVNKMPVKAQDAVAKQDAVIKPQELNENATAGNRRMLARESE